MKNKNEYSYGIVYVAWGEHFIIEAINSAKSLRNSGIDYPICLIANTNPDNNLFNDFIQIKGPSGKKDKLLMYDAPYKKVLFLDTDIIVFKNVIDEMFQLLDRFDIAVNSRGTLADRYTEEVPNSFPEYNTGVIVFKKSEITKKFFDIWSTYFDDMEESIIKKTGRVWDQWSFRKALYFCDLRIAWLPYEYNFMHYFPMIISSQIFIGHGRPASKVISVVGNFNSDKNKMKGNFPTAYIPRLGCVKHYNKMRNTDLFKILFNSNKLVIIEVFKRIRNLFGLG